jgi:flavin reductase (DIM6/NTAB) family NADH-FMN oxidoreductase RutF
MNWYDDILLYPMPVCVITSQDAEGRVNAGAYSLVFPWNGTEGHPQIVFLSRSDSRTATNIAQTREFVLNYVPRSLLRDVLVVGRLYPTDVDKLALTHFVLAPSTQVRVPGIQQAVFQLECVLDQVVRPSDVQTNLIGTIVHAMMEGRLADMGKKERLRRADLAVFFGYEEGNYFFCPPGRPVALPARPELAKGQHLPPLDWDPEAEEMLKKVPAIFRGNVRRAIEARVREKGQARVIGQDVKDSQQEAGMG